jgi:signal transduction histidine kinase
MHPMPGRPLADAPRAGGDGALPGGTAGMAGPGRLVAGALAVGYRLGGRRSGRLVAVTGVTLLAVLFGLQHHPTVNVRVAVLSAFAATAPFAVVRRYPAPALVTMLSVQAGMLLFGRLSWTAVLVLAWLAAIAVCPLLLSRAVAVGVLLAMEAVVVVGAFVHAGPNSTPWDATVGEAVVAAVVWGAGENFRAWRRSRARQRAMASQVRDLSVSEAASRLRVELARELHDVVAHHVSLIAVQAATASYTTGELPADAAAAFEEIATEARTALAELRTVLGVLRTPGAAFPRAPLHGLADLPDLVAGQRRHGVNVALSLEADWNQVPESVQLCVYRVVQEALTNARRHAPGSHVQVAIRTDGDGLHVRVCDDGSGELRVASEPEPGFGLRGISERVIALGGRVRAGGVPGGGFEVAAVIPVPATAA